MLTYWPVFIVGGLALLGYAQVKNMKDILSFDFPFRRIFVTLACGTAGIACLLVGIIGLIKS